MRSRAERGTSCLIRPTSLPPSACATSWNCWTTPHCRGRTRFGKIGYQGFFYHFLGPDGRRKQNFDFDATAETNEALNTVELSAIDTALALAGVAHGPPVTSTRARPWTRSASGRMADSYLRARELALHGPG